MEREARAAFARLSLAVPLKYPSLAERSVATLLGNAWIVAKIVGRDRAQMHPGIFAS